MVHLITLQLEIKHNTLKGWDNIALHMHVDICQIFCAEWSPDGRYIATVCKDGKVRIFDPRNSTDPIEVNPWPTYMSKFCID